MKLRMTWAIAVVMVMGGLYAQTHLQAGDKKEQPKKEEAKEVVVNDALTNADIKDKVRTNSFCKTFTYKMTEGRTYQIDMISNDFDSYLRLENPKGDQVAFDDDSGGFPHARIKYVAPATGDYTVCATTFGGGTGKFKLIVKDVSDGNPAKAGKAIELKNDKGQAKFDGALEAADEKYKGQKIAKVFLFKMEEGKTYQIDHMSKNFDCFLYLEDPNGNLLAQDDDSGGDLNSRIVHKAAKTGAYRIIATSLGGNRTGNFSLSVRATDGN